MNLRKKIQETKEEKAKQEPTNMKQELANIWNIENIAKLIEPFDTEDRAKIFNHILNNKKILARVIYDSRNIAQLKKIFPQKYHEKIYASILHQNILSKLTYDANAIEQLKKVIPQKYHETIYFKLFDTLQKNYHAQKQKEPDSSAATSLLFSSGEKILCAYPRHQKDIYEWASQHIRFNQLSNSEKQKITLVFPEETEINQAWFIEKREQEWEMLKDELKNAIAKKKMDDEEKKYIPTERANQDQNRIDLIAPKAALATQFDPNKQDRYAEFWLKNLPLLIEEFKKVREFHLKKSNSSRGIAEKLYALVANKRFEIAEELNHNEMKLFTQLTYGKPRDSTHRGRDFVCKSSPRFGWQFDALMELYKTEIEKFDHSTNLSATSCIHSWRITAISEGNIESFFLSTTDYSASWENINVKKGDLPEAYLHQPGFLFTHPDADVFYLIFQELDSLVWELLNYQFTDNEPYNETRFWFLLGQTISLLATCMPLQLGSAATTENFMRALLGIHGFFLEPFGVNQKIEINWDIAAMAMPREIYVKNFLDYFEHMPVKSKTLTNTMKAEEKTDSSTKENLVTPRSPRLFSSSSDSDTDTDNDEIRPENKSHPSGKR